jgi:hypothetical protein
LITTPLSRRRETISSLPLEHAVWRGVRPSWRADERKMAMRGIVYVILNVGICSSLQKEGDDLILVRDACIAESCGARLREEMREGGVGSSPHLSH